MVPPRVVHCTSYVTGQDSDSGIYLNGGFSCSPILCVSISKFNSNKNMLLLIIGTDSLSFTSQ